MAADPMAAVESLGIAAVELAHAAGECRLPRLHHQMVAVRQQAIAKAAPVEARAAFAQNLEEQQGVLRAADHRLAAVAAGRQMIGRAGKLEAKRPCPAQTPATTGRTRAR